jgi:hypothetical protein
LQSTRHHHTITFGPAVARIHKRVNKSYIQQDRSMQASCPAMRKIQAATSVEEASIFEAKCFIHEKKTGHGFETCV